jgi:lipoprotein NlpI
MLCRAIQADPSIAPLLWQRGISLYYANEFKLAAAQFRRDVGGNPNDTEEAIWAFLAEAQLDGPAIARQKFLEVLPTAIQFQHYLHHASKSWRDLAVASS